VRYEIRPLGPWTGPSTENRRTGAQFRSTWEATLKLLRNEAEWLGATYLVVQVDADPSDIRLDGMLRARARVGFPGVKVSLDSTYGPLTYATDAYEEWRKNVHAVALSMTALRAVDRYGVSTRGEQYRGWAAIEAGPTARTAEQEAAQQAAVFLAMVSGKGITGEAIMSDPGARARAYRQAAARYHPDQPGGSPDLMAQINVARDLLEGASR
jgi:hypothetical protein